MFEKKKIVKELLITLGLDDILTKEGVTELVINKPYQLRYEEKGKWYEEKNEKLNFIACKKLAVLLCRQFDRNNEITEENPIASIKSVNGERVQIAIPPATKEGVVSFTFRKPNRFIFTLQDLIKSGTFENVTILDEIYDKEDKEKLEILSLLNENNFEMALPQIIQKNLNVVVGGGTGSGKTTFTKTLATYYHNESRIITIEDVPELSLSQDNHVSLFFEKSIDSSRSAKKLIESCMRMKPDHILLAEIRGDETWSYLEALNTGHRGSITSVHCNNAKTSTSRICDLIQQSQNKSMNYESLKRVVETTIDVVIYMKNYKVTEILIR